MLNPTKILIGILNQTNNTHADVCGQQLYQICLCLWFDKLKGVKLEAAEGIGSKQSYY